MTALRLYLILSLKHKKSTYNLTQQRRPGYRRIFSILLSVYLDGLVSWNNICIY